jgi:hypothetical protein
MKRTYNLSLLCICGLALLGCKNNEEPVPEGPINGEWELTSVSINVDGNKATEITQRGRHASFGVSTFSYSDNGGQEGAYEVNKEETLLTVTYNSKTVTYPLTVFTANEISFKIKSIDLSNDLFSEEETQIFLLANQQLNLTGRDWEQVSSNGQLASVVFTLTK